MNKQAYIQGFVTRCKHHQVNPGAILKLAWGWGGGAADPGAALRQKAENSFQNQPANITANQPGLNQRLEQSRASEAQMRKQVSDKALALGKNPQQYMPIEQRVGGRVTGYAQAPAVQTALKQPTALANTGTAPKSAPSMITPKPPVVPGVTGGGISKPPTTPGIAGAMAPKPPMMTKTPMAPKVPGTTGGFNPYAATQQYARLHGGQGLQGFGGRRL